MKELETYADLLEYLKTLTTEQLSQPVQHAENSPMEKILDLCPCIAIGTVGEFEFYGTRSVKDNRFHADEIVFLTDYNPLGDDGAVSYLQKADDPRTGNMIDGKLFIGEPQYGPNGPTPKEAQLNPKCRSRWGVAEAVIVKHRCKHL